MMKGKWIAGAALVVVLSGCSSDWGTDDAVAKEVPETVVKEVVPIVADPHSEFRRLVAPANIPGMIGVPNATVTFVSDAICEVAVLSEGDAARFDAMVTIALMSLDTWTDEQYRAITDASVLSFCPEHSGLVQ